MTVMPMTVDIRWRDIRWRETTDVRWRWTSDHEHQIRAAATGEIHARNSGHAEASWYCSIRVMAALWSGMAVGSTAGIADHGATCAFHGITVMATAIAASARTAAMNQGVSRPRT